MNNIEVFPADKSCEQGCATCPLARKNGVVEATTINGDVQETFSFIEKIYSKRRAQYDLHTTSALHLFPSIAYPKLIRMSRFETGKEVRLPGNAKNFSDTIKSLLDRYSISPKVIGFSLVPQHPAISIDDIEILQKILDELAYWYFPRKNKKIEVTIRSNLIKAELFSQILPTIFQKDFELIKGFIERYATFEKYLIRASSGDEFFYNCLYNGSIDTNKIEVLNRVIAEKNKLVTREDFRSQAITASPPQKQFANFAITPQGVMIEHASTRINNPLLWLNHTDFRSTLSNAVGKRGFLLGDFANTLIVQNIVMYDQLYKDYGDQVKKTKNSDLFVIFEKWRPGFLKK